VTRDEYVAWLDLNPEQAAAYDRLSALRESAYTGPIDSDGYPDTTSEAAQILRRIAEQRGIDW
jgi:hypothetical protein